MAENANARPSAWMTCVMLVKVLQPGASVPNAVTNTLFRICPKFMYRKQDEFNAALRKYGFKAALSPVTTALALRAPAVPTRLTGDPSHCGICFSDQRKLPP